MKSLTSSGHDAALAAAKTVVFDFSAPGCAPCRKVPALMEDVLKEIADQDIHAYEINVSEAPDLAARYMVLSVPTLIVFKDGRETRRFNSLPSRAKLVEALQ